MNYGNTQFGGGQKFGIGGFGSRNFQGGFDSGHGVHPQDFAAGDKDPTSFAKQRQLTQKRTDEEVAQEQEERRELSEEIGKRFANVQMPSRAEVKEPPLISQESIPQETVEVPDAPKKESNLKNEPMPIATVQAPARRITEVPITEVPMGDAMTGNNKTIYWTVGGVVFGSILGYYLARRGI